MSEFRYDIRYESCHFVILETYACVGLAEMDLLVADGLEPINVKLIHTRVPLAAEVTCRKTHDFEARRDAYMLGKVL